MTYQIIYSSASSTPMELDELEDILEHAQSSNSTCGITGALVYADGYFLQILEGEKAAVESLMQRIKKDLRHETVVILQSGQMDSAAFSDWRMAYVSATPEQVAQWAGLGVENKLPDVWENLRQNPTRASQVAASILSVLVAGTAT